MLEIKKIIGFADSSDFKNVTIFKNKKDAQAIADNYEKMQKWVHTSRLYTSIKTSSYSL